MPTVEYHGYALPGGGFNLVPMQEGVAPSPFAADAPTVQSLTIDLATARDKVEFPATGLCIWASNATDLSSTIDLRFNDQGGGAIPVSRGFFHGDLPFRKLFITNTAQAGKTLTLYYTAARVRIENPAVTLRDIRIAPAATFSAPADVSLATVATTQVLAANATRRYAYLTNPDNNPVSFRIGDASAGAARGIRLAPGQSIRVEVTAAIYAYNPDAVARVITVHDVSD